MRSDFIAHVRKRDGRQQSLWTHLEEVSEIAGQFAAKVGLKECGEIIGLLHDAGKASKEFQDYLGSAAGIIDPDEDEYVNADAKKGKIDHSSAGAQVIYRNLAHRSQEAAFVAQILSLCITSHHSGLIDCLSPDGEDNFSRRIEKSDEKTHTIEVWSNLGEDDKKRIESLLTDDSLVNSLMVRLKLLREEGDSQDTLIFKFGLLLRFLFSCLIDGDRLSTSDFEFPANERLRNGGKYPSWDTLIVRFERKQFEKANKVDVLRSRVSQECSDSSGKPKGLYELTVPTGGGKTFASLRFALNHAHLHKMDRIFYVIPYTSIIDQNAEEVRKVLEEKGGGYEDKVVLEHHSNLTPEKETKRQNLLSENWDAPIVFTTQVQFFEALYSAGTRGARRMHQLSNSVIIFDEIQTIPIRSVHLFNLGVRFLVQTCGSTVVLCTATQPLLDNVDPKERSITILPDHRIIQDEQSLFRNLKRVTVNDVRKPGGWLDSEIAELVTSEMPRARSVLIVVNTKSSAQRLYEQLRATKTAKVYYLSTNMCPAHRMAVLNEMKERLKKGDPTICVSTQLIEAGVDIDFGSVVRYLAGLDSIAQAAGRCNRHGMRPNGNVFVLNPQNEDLSRLEDIRAGKENAERVLDEYKENPELFDNDVLSPSAMDRYYSYYFFSRKEKMNYPVSSKLIGVDYNLFSLLSTNTQSINEYRRKNNGQSPKIPLKQSFQTAAKAFQAIDSPTRGVVVPYGDIGKRIVSDLCGTVEVEKQYKLIKKAQRYSVNVYENIFNRLVKDGAIHEAQEGTGIFYLDAQYYSNEFGLSKEIVNEMETFIVGR